MKVVFGHITVKETTGSTNVAGLMTVVDLKVVG